MKPARVYAGEIKKLKTREERVAALAKVPEHLRPLVKTHVTNAMMMNKATEAV